MSLRSTLSNVWNRFQGELFPALAEEVCPLLENHKRLVQPFSAWDKIFPDKAVTVAAIDRLVHHATILEMNFESYRRRSAENQLASKQKPNTTAKT